MRRLVLCSGKVYYDIVGHEAHQGGAVAVARIEQLYPFPTEDAAALVASYPALTEVVWAQEEPQNMGPWRSIRHRLEEAAGGAPLRFVGRPWRASPSEGYPTAHLIEQDRIARDALTVWAAGARRRRFLWASSACLARRGPCSGPARRTHRRCLGGRRRQTSQRGAPSRRGRGGG